MKKFIASENAQVIASTRFKNSIEFAVSNTANGHQSTSSRYDVSFVGTIVTLDPTTNMVVCFDFYEHVDITDTQAVDRALQIKLEKISNISDYANHQFITLVKANDFEYYGFVGYADKKEQEIRSMKVANKFMSIYIDIVSKIADDNTPIEEMGFSVRTFNCLKRAHVDTVQQIKELSLADVVKIRNLGLNSVNELESVLNIEFV